MGYRNFYRPRALSVCLWLAGVVVLSPVALPIAAAAPGAQRHIPTQLPTGVVPQHYRLQLSPNAAELRFSAQLEIDLKVQRATRSITLHALDLAFSRVASLRSGVAQVTLDPAAQTATFRFEQPLAPGRHTLTLDYTGKIYKQATGMFALDYESAGGKRRALFTQFEAADARRVIPSWDEPAFKATFDVSLTVPSGQTAVSNMPVAAITPTGEGLQTVQFLTSPRMSTYLLSLNVGDFERKAERQGATELAVVTRAGELAKADFALEAARQSLDWYNDYFGLPYPLPKLDHLAAPGQSQFFGAMENWGSIFYFEYAMLLDPGFSTQRDRQGVFTTVAHETAHQWFGNLVTMAWWDDLWLNEGFASWLAGRAAEKFHPEWQTELGAVEARNWAMRQDALATSHAVVQKVATVDQMSQAFDGITYSKGEAVIRMLEATLGEADWRAGVRAYMRQHAYGNATSHDLWRALEVAAKQPVRRMARDFTEQPGVPLITLKAASCRNGRTQVDLVQGEFAPDRPAKSARRWQVPVALQLAGGAETVKTLVRQGRARVNLPGCGTVVLNAGQNGYFRSAYSADTMTALSTAFAQLPAVDQLGTLHDTWALGLGGGMAPTDALRLMVALPVDADPQVWSAALDIAGEVDRLYLGMPAEQAQWRARMIALLQPLFQRVGWLPKVGETDPTANLRNDLIGTLGDFGDTQVVAGARERLAAETSDPAAIPATLRRTVLGVVARHADATTWESLRARANAEKNAMVRDELFELLGASQDTALAQRALELALTAEPGETTSPSLLRRVAWRHPDLAWDFVQQHLPAVFEKLHASERSSFVPRLGQASVDPAMIDKISAYAQKYIPPDARRKAEESIGTIRERLRVRQTRLPQITAWMAQR
jgi:aminopeptidase N